MSLETRCARESQHPAESWPPANDWATLENWKETLMAIRVGRSKCCSSVQSPTPSHTQPFQIKWEVHIFLKNCVARHYCVVVMIRHASAYGYTTQRLICHKTETNNKQTKCTVYLSFLLVHIIHFPFLSFQSHLSISITLYCIGPVGWGCRINWLQLCRGVRSPANECPGYDTKQSDGEVSAVLELWGMQSTP